MQRKCQKKPRGGGKFPGNFRKNPGSGEKIPEGGEKNPRSGHSAPGGRQSAPRVRRSAPGGSRSAPRGQRPAPGVFLSAPGKFCSAPGTFHGQPGNFLRRPAKLPSAPGNFLRHPARLRPAPPHRFVPANKNSQIAATNGSLPALYAIHALFRLRRCRSVGFHRRRARRHRHQHVRFHRPGIYPIDEGISLLHAADLTGDGLNDLVVANNLRSKINLLYNRTGKTNDTADTKPARKLDLNELPPDARFRIDSIPVDERIGALVVTDLNGDGRPDIAFFGDGKDLEVIYNLGTNGWSDPKRWHIDDGQMSPNALADGDLNGDGRTDLVCSATTARCISSRRTRITRWPSRKKFLIPARPRPCRSWTWTATAKRSAAGGFRQPDAISLPPAKCHRPAWAGNLFQGRRPSARSTRTTSVATRKITS
jgi:hypothetical protein